MTNATSPSRTHLRLPLRVVSGEGVEALVTANVVVAEADRSVPRAITVDAALRGWEAEEENRRLERKQGLKRERERGGERVNPSGGFKRPRQQPPMPLRAPDVAEMSPHEHLLQILEERGYATESVLATSQSFFGPPTFKQVEDYDLTLVAAVKNGDMDGLRAMAESGRSMDACNMHGESILHLCCRRGQAEMLRFLLENGGRADMCDDMGRTPLHDACWAAVTGPSQQEALFECVAALMAASKGIPLLRIVDCRGALPLQYVRREQWGAWKDFLDSRKDQWWPPQTPH